MSATGYTSQRAETHDSYVTHLVRYFNSSGYEAEELPVDGHRPDILLFDPRRNSWDYLDVKTGGPNMAIEINSLQTYWNIQRNEGRRVYIVHAIDNDWDRRWWVLLPESVRVLKGPVLPTGNGSLDDWHLCQPGYKVGARFLEFFPSLRPIEHV